MGRCGGGGGGVVRLCGARGARGYGGRSRRDPAALPRCAVPRAVQRLGDRLRGSERGRVAWSVLGFVLLDSVRSRPRSASRATRCNCSEIAAGAGFGGIAPLRARLATIRLRGGQEFGIGPAIVIETLLSEVVDLVLPFKMPSDDEVHRIISPVFGCRRPASNSGRSPSPPLPTSATTSTTPRRSPTLSPSVPPSACTSATKSTAAPCPDPPSPTSKSPSSPDCYGTTSRTVLLGADDTPAGGVGAADIPHG